MVKKYYLYILRNIIILLLISYFANSFSQDITIDSIDVIFQDARQLAYDGKREESRELCFKILEINNLPKLLLLSVANIKRLCSYNDISVHKIEWYQKRNLNSDRHKKMFREALQEIL